MVRAYPSKNRRGDAERVLTAALKRNGLSFQALTSHFPKSLETLQTGLTGSPTVSYTGI